MKIRNLRNKADAMAAEARKDREAFRQHAKRTLSILERRVGSTAGLAISFSLGFVSGAGSSKRHAASAKAPHAGSLRGSSLRGSSLSGSSRGSATGIAYTLLRGPLGETALKLGSAVLASLLMKYMDERDEPPVPADPSGG